jgi:Holliday junction resolvase
VNANYRKGRRNEYRSIALLEAAGYNCIRAAGSHGIFDIWAVSATDLLLVQVKSGEARLTSADLEAMKLFPTPPNCRKIVHVWRPKQRLPIVSEI